MANNKILVTGGAGFIGSNLVDALITTGEQVVVLDDISSGKREYLNPQAKFFEADVTDQVLVDEIFEQENFTHVFHLAAQISVKDSVANPMHDLEVNARGSYNIFKAALDNKVQKVIFVSTGGALYGDVTEPAHEELPVRPTSPYAIHKFTAERYLELLRKEFGLASAVLRLANVYGPRQFKGGEGAAVAVFTHNTECGLDSTIFGDGTKTRDYIYVGDVVRACQNIMTSDYQGVLNVGTGQRVSVLDLLETIKKVSGKEVRFGYAQDRPGEVQDSVLSIAKIQRELNWQPSLSLEEGIAKTLDLSLIHI